MDEKDRASCVLNSRVTLLVYCLKTNFSDTDIYTKKPCMFLDFSIYKSIDSYAVLDSVHSAEMQISNLLLFLDRIYSRISGFIL